MTKFREVHLPKGVSGRLYLHSIPGRHEPLDEVRKQLQELEVTVIVNLAPSEEVHRKSPEYAKALAAATVPCEVWPLPIQDYGAPSDDAAFEKLVGRINLALRQGKRFLVHCGAGIGRTGTVAVAVLMALGLTATEAKRSVKAAGSGPEVPGQEETLRQFETSLRNGAPI